MDLGLFEEMVREVIHLDHFISIITQHLQVIAAKNGRAQQNTVTQQIGHYFPAERERLDEAVNFIFDGCFEYLAQVKSHRLYRVFQASVDARDLQKLESEILSTNLILGAVIGALNNTSRFLPLTEGHDSKPGTYLKLFLLTNRV